MSVQEPRTIISTRLPFAPYLYGVLLSQELRTERQRRRPQQEPGKAPRRKSSKENILVRKLPAWQSKTEPGISFAVRAYEICKEADKADRDLGKESDSNRLLLLLSCHDLSPCDNGSKSSPGDAFIERTQKTDANDFFSRRI